MWLDRLSSNPTPSGNLPSSNRSYSPAPRRTSNLGPTPGSQRPAFNPRSSSLSLASNDSTTSLLSTSRKQNGSSLKQSSIIPNSPDPLIVLQKLLGSKDGELGDRSKPRKSNGAEAISESDINLDFGGLSLQELALGETSGSQEKLVYNTQTVEECTSVFALIIFTALTRLSRRER
jgi:hypothetical protein